MPIVAPSVPAAAQHIVTGAVQTFLSSLQSPRYAARPAGPYDLAAPQAVYVLTSRQLARTAPLASARRSGWRFLVMQGTRAVAAVDLDAAQSGQPAAVSRISAGPYVEWTARAIRFAQRQPAVKRGDFEVRIVKVPSIYVYALWLHSADRDLLIPFAHPSVRTSRGQRRSKNPLRVFDPKTCFVLLRSLAAARQPFDDSPRANARAADSGPAAKHAAKRKATAPRQAGSKSTAGPKKRAPKKKNPPH